MSAVILIHGLDDTSARCRRMADFLTQAGFETHSLDLVPSDGSFGLERLAEQVGAFVEANLPECGKLDLLGFSMGGIVARYYVQRLGGSSRVRRLITISSPHQGTLTARLRRGAGIRQMRRGSAFLRQLNADAYTLADLQFTSIWTTFDLMILPATSSCLPVGRSIHVGAFAHPLMISDRRVLRLVRDVLSDPA